VRRRAGTRVTRGRWAASVTGKGGCVEGDRRGRAEPGRGGAPQRPAPRPPAPGGPPAAPAGAGDPGPARAAPGGRGRARAGAGGLRLPAGMQNAPIVAHGLDLGHISTPTMLICTRSETSVDAVTLCTPPSTPAAPSRQHTTLTAAPRRMCVQRPGAARRRHAPQRAAPTVERPQPGDRPGCSRPRTRRCTDDADRRVPALSAPARSPPT